MYKLNLERPLSFSSIKKYMECPAKWRYHYITDEEPMEEVSVYRDVGWLVHAGIAEILSSDNFGNDGVQRLRAGVDEITSQEDYSGKDKQKAIQLLAAYAGPDSQIQSLTPTSLIEEEFVYHIGPIAVKGIIDAVVEWNGKTILIDWKVRSRFYDIAAIRNDLQLYIYSLVLEEKYNLKIDWAVQYNMDFRGPSYPRLRKDGEINQTLGKTTESLMNTALDRYGIEGERREQILNQFRDKYVPIDEFIFPVQVKMDNRQHYIDVMLEIAHTIYQDDKFLPYYDTYKCSRCPFLTVCREDALDSHSGF